MKKVSNDLQIVITDNDTEIDVCVHYKCYVNDLVAFSPMDVTGSIYKGYSLSDFKERHKKSYEKDYKRVEVVAVFVDL
jgi:hypothetical protein